MKKLLMQTLMAASILIAGVSGANAQNIGIQFDKMPVGTKMYYEHVRGHKVTDVYAGKRNRNHIVNRTVFLKDGETRISVQTFDAAGRLIAETYHNKGVKGGIAKYRSKPFNCAYQVGTCKYRQTLIGMNFENNGASQSYSGSTVKVKDGYMVQYKAKRGGTAQSRFVTLGQYNLRKTYASAPGKRPYLRLVRIQ